MPEPLAMGPRLDRSGEPWVGRFPGLGSVSVAADGQYSVDVDDGDGSESPESRADALRFGWAEPLSWARRGYSLLAGGAVAPPAPAGGCLVLLGDAHDRPRIMLPLVSQGWSVLGDRLVPASWTEDALMAHPTEAPVLVSHRRASKSGLVGRPARAHSDAAIVDVTRTAQPLPVRAVLTVRVARPNDPLLETIGGHERLQAAVRYCVGGALVPPVAEDVESLPPSAAMVQDLRLARIPAAWLNVRDETIAEALAALVTWWEGLES